MMPTNIDGGTFGTPNRSTIKGQYFKPWWFAAGTPEVRLRDPNPTDDETVIYKDRSFTKSTANAVSDYFWSYSFSPDREEIRPIIRASSDENVIVPNPDDPYLWTYVGVGTATLALNSEGRNIERTVVTTSKTQFTYVFIEFDPDSVAHAAEAAIRSRASAVPPDFDPEIYLNLFTNTIPPDCARNPDFFAGDIDFTCFSVRNDQTGTLGGGTLISPRHYVLATHLPVFPGTTMYFVTLDNQTVARTVVKAQQCVGDLMVGILNEDVPPTIKFAKVLPDDPSRIPIPVFSELPWPVLVLAGHRDKKLSVLTRLTTGAEGEGLSWLPPTDDLAPFFWGAREGDSGSPILMIVDEEPVLCSCFSTGGSGPGYAHFIAEINATMSSLSSQAGASSNYQVTEADVSGFAQFP